MMISRKYKQFRFLAQDEAKAGHQLIASAISQQHMLYARLKSRSGNKHGPIRVQMYMATQSQEETIFTQTELELADNVSKVELGLKDHSNNIIRQMKTNSTMHC